MSETWPHFEEVSPKEAGYFRRYVSDAKKSQGTNARSVDLHSQRDYSEMKMFATRDGKAGYAVTPRGELTSVFKHKDSPYQNVAQRAAEHSTVVAGATHLSAFDTKLPEMYTKGGFTPTGRTPFNPEYKPRGWSMTKQGAPDVVFMRAGNKLGKEKSYTVGKAKETPDYDEGMSKARRLGSQQLKRRYK
jgi:hypothetical protein